MPDSNTPDEPTSEPTVEELLVARIDGDCRLLLQELDALERVTAQLAPDLSPGDVVELEIDRIGVLRNRIVREP